MGASVSSVPADHSSPMTRSMFAQDKEAVTVLRIAPATQDTEVVSASLVFVSAFWATRAARFAVAMECVLHQTTAHASLATMERSASCETVLV